MNDWRIKLAKFMNGRYGFDELSQVLMFAALVLMIASNMFRIRIAALFGWAIFFYAWFRILSKNSFKRQKENLKFLKMKDGFAGARKAASGGRGSAAAWNKRREQEQQNGGFQGGAEDAVEYNYYRCRNCGRTVRVPRGKGKVRITCPDCGNTFIDIT